MFFKPKHSLRQHTQRRIKVEHGDLFPAKLSFIKKYFDYISAKNMWWLVWLHVFSLFITLSFCTPPLISVVNFDEKTAAILIDQRTSNVATIISMTLAVIGILFSNLAVKDNQTYKLLFEKSRLYLILYYTLSVISCLILLSTFRDTININIFESLVLTGTYLVLLILFGIGYLFRTIIKFANASNIQTLLTKELFKEAKENLKVHLLMKLSTEMFIETMRQHDVKPYNFGMAQLNPALIQMPHQNEEKLIYDIHLNILKDELSKDQTGTQRYYTKEISVNILTNEYNNFLLPNPVVLGDKLLDLKRCITTKSKSKLINQSSEFRLYFNSKIVEYSTEGKHAKVGEILTIYKNLYELQMKHV